jgi:histidinol phosphatase-like enzyme
MSQKMNHIVTTDDFWDKMCDFRFIRLSQNQGKIEDDIYYCPNPPDDEFLMAKTKESMRLLSGKSLYEIDRLTK